MSVSVDMDVYEERHFTTMDHGTLRFTEKFGGWLSGLPDPMSPQQRYEIGLDPKADHPLHPHPYDGVGTNTIRRHMACPGDYKPGRGFNDENNLDFTYPVHLKWNESCNLVFKGADPEVPAFGGYRSVHKLVNDDNPSPGPKVTHHENSKACKKQKRVRQDKENGERPSKRAKIADSVKRITNRLGSINLNIVRPEQSSTDAAKKRQSLGFFNTPSPKDTLKRAASTRTRRLSQFFNMSDATPAPLPVVETVVEPTPKKPDFEVNIIILGDARVGKTQLLRAWVDHEVSMDNYTPTDVFEYRTTATVDKQLVQVNFHEAGSALTENMKHPIAYTWHKCIIYCYDIDNEESFKSIEKYKEFTKLYESRDRMVLLGMKKDLRREGPGLDLSGFLTQGKQVTPAEGIAKAGALKMTTHYEVSTKTGDGVKELFELVVKESVAREMEGRAALRKSRREFLVDKQIDKISDGVKSLLHLGKKKD